MCLFRLVHLFVLLFVNLGGMSLREFPGVTRVYQFNEQSKFHRLKRNVNAPSHFQVTLE